MYRDRRRDGVGIGIGIGLGTWIRDGIGMDRDMCRYRGRYRNRH